MLRMACFPARLVRGRNAALLRRVLSAALVACAIVFTQIDVRADDEKEPDNGRDSLYVQLPFVREIDQLCDKFWTSQNAIEKRELTRRAHGLVAKHRSLEGVGVLHWMDASQDGNTVELTVRFEESSRFHGSLKIASERLVGARARQVRRGSKIFEQVARISVGDCVRFRASRPRVVLEFDPCVQAIEVDFESIEACPKTTPKVVNDD